MDAQTALDTAIVTALRLHPSLTTIGIFKNAAEPKVATTFPYILFSYTSGGNLLDSPHDAMEVEVMITAVDDTSTDARVVSGYIDTVFKNKRITFPDSWTMWDKVRQTDFLSRMVGVQNSQYHQIGAFYRFRYGKARS